MRHYNILPNIQIKSASLSKDALKRLTWIDWYYFHGKNAELTCRHFGISKSVFYRWFNRFNKKNLNTLEFDTKTRRPVRVRTPNIDIQTYQRIYDIRKNDPEKSKYEIQEELRREDILIGQSTIQRVINSHRELSNTQHNRQVKKHRVLKIARIKASVELREKSLGSLVQVDTKYFYVLGRKFYIFSAIDCKSRYAFIYCYKTISSASGKDFIKRVRDYFPFPIQAINTDNGSEYLLEFHKEVSSWGIPHFFTDPYCPKQNGRVERLHQTAEYEYFNYQYDLLDDLQMINEHCMLFNNKYNTKRFHRSLGYKTPLEVVLECLQKEGGQPFSI
jgi:transposase InsO family protein